MVQEPSVRDMDFSLSPTADRLRDTLLAFMDEHVYPAEPCSASRWRRPAILTSIRP